MTKQGPQTKPLTIDDLRRQGLLDELARVFREQHEIDEVLDRIDMDMARRPPQVAGQPPLARWRELCRLIETGAAGEEGLRTLLAVVHELRPFNRVFEPWAQREAEAPLPLTDNEAQRGASVFVVSPRPATELLGRMRQLASQRGVPGPVSLAVTNETGLAGFDLPEATGEQAQGLVEAFRAEMQRVAPTTRISMGTNQSRSTVLDRLLIEGPDGAHFEVNDVPANTPPRELGRAIMSEYADAKFWPRDPVTSQPRDVVIDLIKPDGSSKRLDPEKPIGRQGVREGDSLTASPESRAGAVNPVLRNEAIARVRTQVLSFAQGHPGFTVLANYPDAPTEYTFTFAAPSFGPPPSPGALPEPNVDQHKVFVLLSPEFPIKAPQAFWQTTIYHPNIDPKTGYTCLGALADHYRPGRDFGDICQMLIDIAGYQNYETREGFNLEAQRWAVSPEGQVAIEKRGGVSLARQLRRAAQDAQAGAPKFKARRVEA